MKIYSFSDVKVNASAGTGSAPVQLRIADEPPSEPDSANSCLIGSGNPLTGRLPDVRYKPVSHFFAVGPVAFQIACQQLLLAKNAHNQQPDHGKG